MSRKNLIISTILLFTVLSCKKNQNSDILDLEGDFHYSNNANLSYYFPKGFTPFISENEDEYNNIVSKISNQKLKKILSGYYIENHILPTAKNFQYLFKEDSTSYQNIFVNEVDYFRLNDSGANALSAINKININTINKDSTLKMNLQKDYFINKRDYQIIVNKGYLISNNDTIYLENYIVSKHYRTFSIQIESDKKTDDFLPYIKEVQFGHKRKI